MAIEKDIQIKGVSALYHRLTGDFVVSQSKPGQKFVRFGLWSFATKAHRESLQEKDLAKEALKFQEVEIPGDDLPDLTGQLEIYAFCYAYLKKAAVDEVLDEDGETVLTPAVPGGILEGGTDV